VSIHVWDIRSTDGGSTGLPFARGRLEARESIIGHALPSAIDVFVTEEDGTPVASGRGLRGDADTPMGRLMIEGRSVRRAQIWPGAGDLSSIVILPGGETGVLTAWWNAPDHSEWRWSVEFSNHR